MLRTPLRALASGGVFLGELFRQPWLLFIVILGPFLILLAYGLGARITRDFPRTIVVQPPAAAPTTLQVSPEALSAYLNVVDVTPDREAALARLRRGEVELVLELPGDPQAALARGEQARIRLATNEINPIATAFAQLYVESQIATLNRQAIARTATSARGAAESAQGDVERLATALERLDTAALADQQRRLTEVQTLLGQLDTSLATLEDVVRAAGPILGVGPGTPLTEVQLQRERVGRLRADVRAFEATLAQVPTGADATRLRQGVRELQGLLATLRATPPEVLAAPFLAELENVAPYQPSGAGYFVPGILALVLQHLGLTLAAVSLARDRRLGIFDLYRLAPASAGEVLVGKYMGLGLMIALIAVGIVLLVVWALGVPILAGLTWLAAALGVFLLATLALGFVLGLVTRSEDAAIQVAMLVLIASVAFGGLLAPQEQLTAPLRAVAQLLPVTHATVLLQAVLFRGYLLDPVAPTLLAVLGIVMLVLSFRLFRRELAERR